MDSAAERTLNNLHVLSAVSHNDKLMTNEDSFDIYVPTSLRGMLRAWYGERRGQNVQRIRQTVRAAIQFSTRSYDESVAMLDARQSNVGDTPHMLRAATMVLHHLRMLQALQKAQVGLGNLLLTYREDAALASQITLISEEIDDYVSVMEPHSKLLRTRCGVRDEPPSDDIDG